MLKSPELLKDFRVRFLRQGEGKSCRVCDQLEDVLLIGQW